MPSPARSGRRCAALAAALALIGCAGDDVERCRDPLVLRFADRAPVALTAIGARGVALVDGGELALRDDRGVWTAHPLGDLQPRAVAGDAAGDLHLITADALLHWDGAALRPVDVAGADGALSLTGLARDGADAWSIGEVTPAGCPAPCADAVPLVIKARGTVGDALIADDLPRGPAQIGAASGVVYVIGVKGLHRLADGAWSTFDVDATALHVAAPDDVLLVDPLGGLLRFDGQRARAIAPAAGAPGHGYGWRAVIGFGGDALALGVAGARDGAAFALAGDRLWKVLDTSPSRPIAGAATDAGGYLLVDSASGPELWGFECLD